MNNKSTNMVRCLVAELRDIARGIIEECRREYRQYNENRLLMKEVNRTVIDLLLHMQVYNRLLHNSITLQRLLVMPCLENHRHIRPIAANKLDSAAKCLTPPPRHLPAHFLFVQTGSEIQTLEAKAAALTLKKLEDICDTLHKMQNRGGVTDQARLLIQAGMLHYQQMKRYWQSTSQSQEVVLMHTCPKVPQDLALLYLEVLISARVLEIEQETRQQAWLSERTQVNLEQAQQTMCEQSNYELQISDSHRSSFYLLQIVDETVLDRLYA
jgi:hypothetical protein